MATDLAGTAGSAQGPKPGGPSYRGQRWLQHHRTHQPGRGGFGWLIKVGWRDRRDRAGWARRLAAVEAGKADPCRGLGRTAPVCVAAAPVPGLSGGG
jgi:hypothetical protein